ncbi:hypothetical protein B1R32_1066 [Abditibacterium utsteinense]|uniref:Uncharacterized protein n=1 Tax=Abditibacterium utsteinense TaxID=1960156 RepID=A0A2S8STN1_9BACT|nr:hypothetical protein B1R32_1066 [Abditibacterium utsteinense]
MRNSNAQLERTTRKREPIRLEVGVSFSPHYEGGAGGGSHASNHTLKSSTRKLRLQLKFP